MQENRILVSEVEHRTVRMVATETAGGRHVRAAVEDRFHHFRVDALLGELSIESIHFEPIRYPFSLCPLSSDRAQLFRGAPLFPRMADYFRLIDAREQCTHQLDLAAFAIALGARGITERRYDLQAKQTAAGCIAGSAKRADGTTFAMEVVNDEIVSPTSFAGRSLGGGFTAYTVSLDVDIAEAALLLRRMFFVTSGGIRSSDPDRQIFAPPLAGCWVTQPARNREAKRIAGNELPPGTSHDLTVEDDQFLQFV